MDTESQIRELFKRHGMTPEQIRYNPNLDYYHVNIGVEGTEDRFLEGVMELGSEEPVDNTVDTGALQTIAGRIDGARINDGEIDLMEMMGDSHFKLQIE